MAGQVAGTTNTPGANPAGVAGSPTVPGRRRAEHGTEPGSARATLLSRAGRLLGTSLDTGRTLAAIAELVVPSFADQCVVDLLEDTGALRRAVSVRAGPGAGAPGEHAGPGGPSRRLPERAPLRRRATHRRPVLAEFDQPRPAAVAAGRARRAQPDDGRRDGDRRAAARPARHQGRARGRRGRDQPEVQRGRRGTGGGGRGARGFALENAALYESMRSLALALQHSLLPATCRRSTASRCRSATTRATSRTSAATSTT